MSRKRNAIARVMSATCAVAVAFSSCENKKSLILIKEKKTILVHQKFK